MKIMKGIEIKMELVRLGIKAKDFALVLGVGERWINEVLNERKNGEDLRIRATKLLRKLAHLMATNNLPPK